MNKDSFIRVCPIERIPVDRGAAALVDGHPVAIFRLSGVHGEPTEWCAANHLDPGNGAPIMARGLVGSVGEPPIVMPTVASPLDKLRYNLRTGFCLDDSDRRLDVYPVRIVDGWVEVMSPA